ncbi:methyltransferase [Secundilactobacillus kimchicus]|uniref:O-methyltransferase n=1 Tax=Secundilactobacillus kimchicus JCM 15530 TaxID=1302272 RepID=A0A0R1HS63_9LACO|nr:tRNA1(Val) (adenine(37)-N6)-methyltransferase [Secundilactobacillus kimchicus]KRK49456.1 O-methyltransferase [Secundilactobacillus kimchicus JCM 15530]MBT9673002.1 methyltransferase [Secundilactobacillus kimchicus]
MTQDLLRQNERIDQLYSQNISIIQSPEVFSFSLDAVLLADFAKGPVKPTGQMVDLCAGNGAVGLFMASKSRGHILMVELQERLADMAQRSVILNHLDDRIDVLNRDLATITDTIAKDSVDVVTCNPPYFADLPSSKKNPNPYLAIARHEMTTNLTQIVMMTSDLLKMGGRAYFVHRPDRLLELTRELAEHRLSAKRVKFVYPKPGKPANMVLIEAIKDGKQTGLTVLPPLMTYGSDGHYSDEVRKMLYGNHHAGQND